MAYCIVVQWGLLVGQHLPMLLTVSDDMSERCCVPWVPTGLPWASADEPTEGICALDPKGIGGGVCVSRRISGPSLNVDNTHV